ncbi:phosphatase PAP2 family protein [Ruania zhangjianzhongii]|uniref:phosphatase PAP2 family protein n=1 Tax=Ruania zhangjianzhongii TaxID=2603206 RepID=UPI0011C780C8|nr:phosphatase PAP2 family protein [Ruania zhangjianzhongii]
MASPQPPSALLRTLPVAGLLALIAGISWPLRATVYRSVAPSVAASPVGSALAGAFAQYGPLLLGVLAGVLAVSSFWRERAVFWRLVSGGVGVIGASVLSTLLKLLVTEERPCRVWDVETVLACPSVGDWSWPSGHSTVAAALATACIIAAPRTAWFAVPAAVLAGAARLAAGVHYLHDVASGLALGAVVVALVVVLLRPLAARLPVARGR